jgi:hypothetical protein
MTDVDLLRANAATEILTCECARSVLLFFQTKWHKIVSCDLFSPCSVLNDMNLSTMQNMMTGPSGFECSGLNPVT